MNRFLLFFLLLIILPSCSKEEEEPIVPLSVECQGRSMVGTWLKVSDYLLYPATDSMKRDTSYSQMVLYEHGEGHISTHSLEFFFLWNLQCDPDIFTTSTPFHSEDSLITDSGFFGVCQYKILINQPEYKKMTQRYRTNSNTEEEFYKTLELFKKN